MPSNTPKKKPVKKVSVKKDKPVKKVKKEKPVLESTPPYFPPPYFSSNWGGNTSPATPTPEKPKNQPPYFPPPYFSSRWGGRIDLSILNNKKG